MRAMAVAAKAREEAAVDLRAEAAKEGAAVEAAQEVEGGDKEVAVDWAPGWAAGLAVEGSECGACGGGEGGDCAAGEGGGDDAGGGDDGCVVDVGDDCAVGRRTARRIVSCRTNNDPSG